MEADAYFMVFPRESEVRCRCENGSGREHTFRFRINPYMGDGGLDYGWYFKILSVSYRLPGKISCSKVSVALFAEHLGDRAEMQRADRSGGFSGSELISRELHVRSKLSSCLVQLISSLAIRPYIQGALGRQKTQRSPPSSQNLFS